MTEKAKFRYSAHEGVIELEGTEDFVSKHFEDLTDLVRVMARHTVIEQNTNPVEPTEMPSSATLSTLPASQEAESIADYPTVYSEINGKLKLVCDIPGDNKRVQMTTVALLYCYGASLMGDDQVTSKDIREVCEEHGCLDGANFSKVFDDKTVFLSDGVKGGTKHIKLTFQGRKKAKEVLGNG